VFGDKNVTANATTPSVRKSHPAQWVMFRERDGSVIMSTHAVPAADHAPTGAQHIVYWD
jgi:hypothetical protein